MNEAAVICLALGFLAGYLLHGWQFDRALDDLRKQIDAIEAGHATPPEAAPDA